MIKMKALRSGNIGDGAAKVRRGREFSVSAENRAKELEAEGMAYRLSPSTNVVPQESPVTPNVAAEAGPFDSVGGKTGVEEPAQLSLQDQAPRQRRSRRSGGGSQS